MDAILAFNDEKQMMGILVNDLLKVASDAD